MKEKFLILIGLLVLSCVVDWQHFKMQKFYKLIFFDVHQGDAALIRTPTNCNILIDAGPTGQLVNRIGKHLPVLEKQIDLAILSHPHMDHMGGFLDLMHKFEFKKILITGVEYDLPEYFYFLENADNLEVVFNPTIYNVCGVTIEVLAPFKNMFTPEVVKGNLNNTSIIVSVKIKDKYVFFSGDAELEQELEFLEIYKNREFAEFEIVKAGHHGSRTSSNEDLLKKLKPKQMVISSGENNSYGHPHLETIQKAGRLGIEILRTDQLSDVVFYW